MASTLSARPRQTRGKNAARRLRQEGFIPAVIYGHGEESHAIEISANEFDRLLSSISVETTLIELRVDGEQPMSALIREVQHHPSRPVVLHVDFFHVHAGEKIHLQVPVRLHGDPVGVRDQGGVLQQVLHDLDVECLPKDIPEAVDIDVAQLAIGDSIHVSDVPLPNVRILNDAELVVCTVTPPTAAALPESAETEEGIGGDVEPELIRDRRRDAEDTDFSRGSAQPE